MQPTPYQPDFDTRWKELIKALHKDVVLKFFPKLHGQIDWGKGVKYLDKELAKVLADWEKKGKKTGDLLFEYQLKNGKKQLVLIHIEVQHGYDPELPKRMFISYYRIRDRHPDKQLTALAIYTGPRIPKYPGTYKEAFEGVDLTYNFNYLILKNQNADELLASGSPIDLALLAGMHVLKIKDYRQRTFRYKLKLSRLCLERGYDKQATGNLLTFVLYTIALPKEEQEIFNEEFIKMTDMKLTPLIEVDPMNAKLLAHWMLGKSLEDWVEEQNKERDKERDKKRILHAFYGAKLSVEVISKVLDIDLKSVKKVISEAKKSDQKKKGALNGKSQKDNPKL